MTASRVHNHTDRELIIATDDGGEHQVRLLPGCLSPRGETPRLLWAAPDPGAPIDGAMVWRLDGDFDVHVTQTGAGSAAGSGALHITGLGAHAVAGPAPRTTATRVWLHREDEIWVTVLGAGITGLTAAHELVMRGFRVQVIERAHGSPADASADDGAIGLSRFRRGVTSPAVGGIARTQWSTLPRARTGDARDVERAPPGSDPQPGVHRHGTASAQRSTATPEPLEALHSVHGDALWFGARHGGPCASGGYDAFGVRWKDEQLECAIDDLAARLELWLREVGARRSLAGVQLVVVVYGGPAPDRAAHGYRRLDAFLGALAADRPAVAALRAMLDRLHVLPTARIDVAEAEPDGPHVGLIVRVHDDVALVAGEHGFRFFPGFYRHLRDTMRRTPLYDAATGAFTPRVALDNLQEIPWQVVVDPARRDPLPMWRKPFSTIGATIEQYRAIRRNLGYRPIDMLRFVLRILRYATSSTARRAAHYEDMSWWTFMSKPHPGDPRDEPPLEFGARFAEALHHAPKALVAMGSAYADARTQGNLAVQLWIDQFGLHPQTDSALIGPTSTSWLSHWRRYLEHQGVRFFLGEVTRIVAGPAPGARAGIDVAFAGGAAPAAYVDGERMAAAGAIRAHYVVSALDVVGLARATTELRAAGGAGVLADLHQLVGDDRGGDRDLEDIAAMGRIGPDDGLGDRFQTLTGIQLYYRRPFTFAHGHIYYVSSPWGLSAISQPQFWGPFGARYCGGLATNLSIDIGSWRGDATTPDPNRLDRDAIAASIQDQVDRIAPGDHQPPHGSARYYHLDDFLGFSAVPGPDGRLALTPRRNHAPFLINVTGDWQRRPRGEPWSPNTPEAGGRTPGAGTLDGPLWTPSGGGYVVHHGNLVIAGTHMRTFTRMATMEAANESARHAVNAILDHLTWSHGERSGDYCEIWDPERHELADLDLLRRIDGHLMAAGARTCDDDAPPGRRAPPAPHLFDILGIDQLAEHTGDDRQSIDALGLIGGILDALGEAQVDDLPSVFRVIDRARRKLAELRAR